MPQQTNETAAFLTKNSEFHITTMLRTFKGNITDIEQYLSILGHDSDPNAKYPHTTKLWSTIDAEPAADLAGFMNQMKQSGKKASEFIVDKVKTAMGMNTTASTTPEIRAMASGFQAMLHVKYTVAESNAYYQHRGDTLEQVLPAVPALPDPPSELTDLDEQDDAVIESTSSLAVSSTADAIATDNLVDDDEKDGVYSDPDRFAAFREEVSEEAKSICSGYINDEDDFAETCNEMYETIQEINRLLDGDDDKSELTIEGCSRAQNAMEKLGSDDLRETAKDLNVLERKEVDNFNSTNEFSTEAIAEVEQDREGRAE